MNTDIELDLMVDLNTQDDTGLPWTLLSEAVHPERIIPGKHIVVGAGSVRAVAVVVDIDGDIVHVMPRRGSVASNAHLLDDEAG